MVQVESNLGTVFRFPTPHPAGFMLLPPNADSTVPDSAPFPPAFNFRHLSIQIYWSLPFGRTVVFPNLTSIRISSDEYYPIGRDVAHDGR